MDLLTFQLSPSLIVNFVLSPACLTQCHMQTPYDRLCASRKPHYVTLYILWWYRPHSRTIRWSAKQPPVPSSDCICHSIIRSAWFNTDTCHGKPRGRASLCHQRRIGALRRQEPKSSHSPSRARTVWRLSTRARTVRRLSTRESMSSASGTRTDSKVSVQPAYCMHLASRQR